MYFKNIATHTGEFLGVAPTGKKITLYGIATWRIVDGKIVEKGSQVWDFMDIYKQLGIIEYTEKECARVKKTGKSQGSASVV